MTRLSMQDRTHTTKIDVTRYESSVGMWNSSLSSVVAVDGADDANVL